MAENKNVFEGEWRIVDMGNWDNDYIDLVRPGCICFSMKRGGSLRFGCVEAGVDYRVETQSAAPRIVFSFSGKDEGHPICGRGWAEIDGKELLGRLFLYCGDESSFKAKKK